MSTIDTFKNHYNYLQTAVQEDTVHPLTKAIQKRFRKYFKKLEKATEKQQYAQSQESTDADTLAAIRDLTMQLDEIHYFSKEFKKSGLAEHKEEKKRDPSPERKPEPRIDIEKISGEAYDEGFAAG